MSADDTNSDCEIMQLSDLDETITVLSEQEVQQAGQAITLVTGPEGESGLVRVSASSCSSRFCGQKD